MEPRVDRRRCLEMSSLANHQKKLTHRAAWRVALSPQSQKIRAETLLKIAANVVMRIGRDNLMLVAAEYPEGLKTTFEYNTDLFDKTTIERMMGHFQVLLEGGLVAIDESAMAADVEQHRSIGAGLDFTMDARYRGIRQAQGGGLAAANFQSFAGRDRQHQAFVRPPNDNQFPSHAKTSSKN